MSLGLGFGGSYVPRNRSLVGFNLYSFFKNEVITCAPNWAPPTKQPTAEGLCLVVDSQGTALRGFKMNIQSSNHLKKSRPYELHALFGFSLAFDEVSHIALVALKNTANLLFFRIKDKFWRAFPALTTLQVLSV